MARSPLMARRLVAISAILCAQAFDAPAVRHRHQQQPYQHRRARVRALSQRTTALGMVSSEEAAMMEQRKWFGVPAAAGGTSSPAPSSQAPRNSYSASVSMGVVPSGGSADDVGVGAETNDAMDAML